MMVDFNRRLGFPVKILGQPNLKSNDARRWQSGPHLRTSLQYLEAIFAYLRQQDIRMYRMSSDLAPYATHPDLPQFHRQIAECSDELAELGKIAKSQGLRLSFHPSQFIVLNSPDPVLVARSIADIESQAEILDRMGLGPEAVVVIHIGGGYGNTRTARARWITNWARLSDSTRSRLVLENDDTTYSAADTLHVHSETGVRLVFDYHHFCCLNPEGLELVPVLKAFLATWPPNVQPKIHFSTPRADFRILEQKSQKTGKTELVSERCPWTSHADFINPFEFINFLKIADDLPFDVMLEAKAKDLALLRLRADTARYAPTRSTPLTAADANRPARHITG